MSVASGLLAILIMAALPIVVLDGRPIQGLIALVSALALASVAHSLRPGEGAFLRKILRPFVVIAAVPFVWMVFQTLPMPRPLAHPIWESAAGAIGERFSGSISIDTGATLVACSRYLTFIAITVLATAVGLDRRRAQRLLFILAGVSVVIGLIAAVETIWGFELPAITSRLSAISGAIDSTAVGIILAATSAVCAFERSETRQTLPKASIKYLSAVALWTTAAITAWGALMAIGSGGAIFAANAGLVVLATVVLIRRLGADPWGSAGIGLTAVLVTCLLATPLTPRSMDVTLALASPASPLTSLTERMMVDRLWVGSGAGTFSALVPIYRDPTDANRGEPPPTAAAALSIELGRPMLWVALMGVLVIVVVLLRGALQRGRDSFYPTAGASCLVTVALLAISDAGMFNTSISILTGTTLGLAIAHHASRSTELKQTP